MTRATPVHAARNVAASALSQVVGKVSTLVFTLLAARTLTQSEFGLFGLALSIALLASAVAEWGFDPVLIVRSSRHPERLEQHYAEAVLWQGVVAAPVFVVAAVVAGLAEPQLRLTLALLLAAALLDLWSDTARAVSVALRRQTETAVALVVQRIATMLLAVPLLLLGAGTAGLAGALLAASVLGGITHRLALRRLGVRFRRELLTRSGMRAFAAGTRAIGINALVLMALFRLDAVLLNALSGPAALGSYTAAYRLFETTLFVTFAVSSALFPVFAADRENRALARRTIETGLGTVAVVYLPFAALCLVEAQELLRLLYGEPYATTSTGALRWLALAPLPYAAAFLASAVLTAVGRTGVLLGASVLALVVNLGLNLALVPRLDGTGAAAATVAGYLVQAAVLLWLLARWSGRPGLVRPLAAPLLACGPLLAVAALTPFPFLVEAPLALTAYAVTWLALASRIDPGTLRTVRTGLRRGAA